MNNKKLTFASFILIMIALGSSDSLRGIFSSIFQSHFNLSTTQLSMIVTVSYLGNLIFLLVGGKLMDKYQRKTSLMVTVMIWLCALGLFLLTDNYYCLLVGMFFAMGASTLINTTINIITPALFAASPGFIVNFLFFTQGVGTSGSQTLLGNNAKGFSAWKITILILLALGMASLILMVFIKIPSPQRTAQGSHDFRSILRSKPFVFLVFIFGFYFIAEHGILNWLVAYSTNSLGLSMGKASNYLAVFFGGITIGRLLLSPLVDKFGVIKSLRIFSIISAVLYIVGIAFGGAVIILLSLAGFFMSIIYPTLVMTITKFYPSNSISTVTGMVISVASVFDILFNMVFGRLIDSIGYQRSFLILPISMALFVVLFFYFTKTVKPDTTIQLTTNEKM